MRRRDSTTTSLSRTGEKLVEQAVAGDKAALTVLLTRAQPGLHQRIAARIPRDLQASVGADDIVLEDPATLESIDTGGRTMMELERDVILSTLARLNGNRTHTAKALGITVRTVRNRLRKYRGAGGGAAPPTTMAS